MELSSTAVAQSLSFHLQFVSSCQASHGQLPCFFKRIERRVDNGDVAAESWLCRTADVIGSEELSSPFLFVDGHFKTFY